MQDIALTSDQIHAQLIVETIPSTLIPLAPFTTSLPGLHSHLERLSTDYPYAAIPNKSLTD